jgi:hypothetical protein
MATRRRTTVDSAGSRPGSSYRQEQAAKNFAPPPVSVSPNDIYMGGQAAKEIFLGGAAPPSQQNRSALELGWSDQLIDAVANQLDSQTTPPDAPPYYEPSGGGGGGGGGGYAAAIQAQLQAELDQQMAAIGRIYEERLKGMTSQKDANAGVLAQALTDHQAAIAKISNDYKVQRAAVDQSMAKLYADTLNRVTENKNNTAKVLSQFGVDPNLFAPAAAKVDNYVSQQQQVQREYGSRMEQLSDASMANQKATGESIKQAGATQLEQNFNKFQTQLNLERMKQEQAAQASYNEGLRSLAMRSAGGGGGGGGSSSSDLNWAKFAYQQEKDARDYELDLMKLQMGQKGGFDLDSLDPNSDAYLAAVTGGDLKGAASWLQEQFNAGAFDKAAYRGNVRQLQQSYGSNRLASVAPQTKGDYKQYLTQKYKR